MSFTFSSCLKIIRLATIALLLLILNACNTSKQVSSNTESEKQYKSKSAKRIKEAYSELIGVSEKEITNIPLYEFIDEWYGVPYKYNGDSKKGIDCSGLAELIYASVYKKTIKGSAEAIFNQCKEVKRKDLKEGDLLFFKIESKNISHIAVYLQNNRFVHASSKKGVRIDSLDDPYIGKYFYKAGKLP